MSKTYNVDLIYLGNLVISKLNVSSEVANTVLPGMHYESYPWPCTNLVGYYDFQLASK